MSAAHFLQKFKNLTARISLTFHQWLYAGLASAHGDRRRYADGRPDRLGGLSVFRSVRASAPPLNALCVTVPELVRRSQRASSFAHGSIGVGATSSISGDNRRSRRLAAQFRQVFCQADQGEARGDRRAERHPARLRRAWSCFRTRDLADDGLFRRF